MSKFEGFIGGAYRMASLPISAQRCVNWYPETQQDGDASSLKVLQPSAGYRLAIEIVDATLPEGSFTRGVYNTSRGIGLSPDDGGSVVWVIGPNVYWLKPDLTYELLGEITNSTTTVKMTDDGFGLVLEDGTNIYRLDLKTKEFGNVGFNLHNPTDVAFLAGYTLTIGTADDLPQNTFFWSGLYDNSSWGALDYASAEQSQDPITAMEVAGSYLYLFGPQSYELWSNTGDADLPFQRSYASSGSIGIYAPKSLIKFGNSVYMIGTSGNGSVAAYKSQGTEMIKISDIPLDTEWGNNYTQDCTTWSDTYAGHDFIYFNFDALDKTYVYDIGENEWSEAASREELTDTLHRWEPNFAVSNGKDTLVGDRYSAKLYYMGTEYSTENGKNILRIRTTSHQNAQQKVMKINALAIDLDQGNGITDEDPDGRYTEAAEIMLRYSHDRARTWSSELRQSMGALGDYTKAVEYARMGACRNLTIEFKISDPTRTSILNGWIYPEVGQRQRGT